MFLCYFSIVPSLVDWSLYLSQRVLSERTQKWTSVLLSGSVPVIETQINLFKINKQIWDQTRTLNRLVCHSLDSGSGFNCSYLNKRNKSKTKQTTTTTTTTTKQAKRHISVPRAQARRNEVESERARLLWARPLHPPRQPRRQIFKVHIWLGIFCCL